MIPPGLTLNQFKMQVITTILLVFVAQTIAAPSLQTRDDPTGKICTLANLAFHASDSGQN